jgi:cytochrome c5
VNRGRLLALIVAAIVAACSDDETPATQDPTTQDDAQAAASQSVAAASDPAVGQTVFEHWCLPCHAPGGGHPGTNRLAERLSVENSVILERSGLTVDYVKAVVRNGFQMMPPFRITEVSEQELDAVANYVASHGGHAGR